MRRIILSLLIMFPLALNAQILKERRVYYLDCSYSMVTNKIWDDVCDNLKKAIDNVNDETTELVVIPFALGQDGGIKILNALATANGKEALKKQISSIVPSRSSKTYHYVPLQDFYANRVNPSKVTYMFLMTDGQDEYKVKTLFPEKLKEWQTRYGDKNVYGFYVMLHSEAQNSKIDGICNTQKHLWKVETADINVNLTRLQNTAVFNARNDKYFDLPIYGNTKVDLKVSFDNSSPYRVGKTSIENGKLRVFVTFNGSVHSLPVSKVFPLHVKMTGGGQYDFLVTDIVNVKCESKPERSLKVMVK